MSQTSSIMVPYRYLTLILLILILGCTFGYGQSTSQDYPSPIVSNELSGAVKPRDIGDPRVTTYYYTFNGNQGDLFINVVTKNLNGNIDVFSVDGLRLLTRILVFADVSDNETGRVVYLRKPERLILRVEGRTPNDDPATFQVKFAGSFEAVSGDSVPTEPKLPTVHAENDTGIRVNSAGAIIEVRPKPTPAVAARTEKEETSATVAEKPAERPETSSEKVYPEERSEEKPKTAVIVEDRLPAPEKAPKARKTAVKAPPRTAVTRRERPRPSTETSEKSRQGIARETEPTETVGKKERPKTEKPVDPLANVNLIVEFKDGRRFERPMSDVFRFTVDHGSLTIIRKDGKIDRFAIIEVAKVSVEQP